MRLTFCGPGLKVHHCNDTAEAEAFYAAEAGVSLMPPISPSSAADLGGLKFKERVEVQLRSMSQAIDISISGLGWISVGALVSPRLTFAEMQATIDVWLPERVQMYQRPVMP